MKDFMANGRFSRGVEVSADASLAYVGNIDHSIEQIVNSDRVSPVAHRRDATDPVL
jgi:ATP-dependent Lon protease